MKPDCIKAVQTAAGRTLTKSEIDGIESRIKTALRDFSVQRENDFLAMSPSERVVEAAKLARERMMQDVVKAHETEVRNAAIRANLDGFLNAFQPGKNGKLLAVMQKIFFDAGSRINDTSLEMNRKAVMNDFMRQLTMVQKFDAGKFFGYLQDLSKRDAMFKELAGETSGDPEAAKVAKAFMEVNKFAADRAERAGIGFHELDNWRSPQSMDWIKVSRDKDAWMQDHLNWVDRRAYVKPDGTRMNDEELKKFLEAVWETQATNGANKRADTERGGSGYGGLGVSRNKPRQVHYKDAASYIAAMDKYGRSNNVYSLFMQHFNQLSRDISIAEMLGRDHETNFNYMVEKAFGDDVKAAKTDKEKQALEGMKTGAYRMYSLLTRGEEIGNPDRAMKWAAVRSVISSSMLGGIFSSLPDFAMIGMTAKMNGMPALRAMGQSFKGMFSGADRADVERVGLAVEAMQAAANRFGLEEIGTNAPAVLNEAVHKLSLLAALDRGMRSGIGLVMMDTLGKITRDKNLADLDGGDFDFLVKSKGVTEQQWNVWKLAELDAGESGKRTLLSPDAIYNIADDDLLPLVQEAIAKRSAVYKEAIDGLNARNEVEKGWLAKAWDKFNASRDKANKLLNEYVERNEARLEDVQRGADARGGLLFTLMEQAELEAQIAKLASENKNAAQVARFFDEIKSGVQSYGNQRDMQGQKLGARRRMLEDDIRDVETRNRRNQKAFDAAEVKAKTRLTTVESELNGYLKRQTERIEKKIAQIQRGKSLDTTVEKLQGEADRMSDRMEKRQETFDEWRDRLKTRREEAKARNDKATAAELAKIEELEKKIELAEAQHDIDAYLATEQNRDRLQVFADNITWRSKQASERAFTKGEALGRRKAELEARVKELQERVDRRVASFNEKVQGKADALDARFQERIADLRERATEYADRAARRAEYVTAFQTKFGKIESEETARAKSDAVTKLLSVALSEIQAGARGASGSSIREKVNLGLDRGAGTVTGEIWRMVLLLKQTPLGIAYTHLFQRPAAFDGWKSQWWYRAQFIGYTTMLGALATQLKSLQGGEDPVDMTEPKFWGKAAVAGGGFGIFGDLLFAEGAHTTNGLTGLLGGPGLSMAEDAFRLAQAAKQDFADTGEYNYGSKFLEFARKYATPLANIWYVRAAFNHMIYHNLQEMLDPGWSGRLQTKMQQKGVEFWWSPGPQMPERAPDFSNVIQ